MYALPEYQQNGELIKMDSMGHIGEHFPASAEISSEGIDVSARQLPSVVSWFSGNVLHVRRSRSGSGVGIDVFRSLPSVTSWFDGGARHVVNEGTDIAPQSRIDDATAGQKAEHHSEMRRKSVHVALPSMVGCLGVSVKAAMWGSAALPSVVTWLPFSKPLEPDPLTLLEHSEEKQSMAIAEKLSSLNGLKLFESKRVTLASEGDKQLGFVNAYVLRSELTESQKWYAERKNLLLAIEALRLSVEAFEVCILLGLACACLSEFVCIEHDPNQ